MAPFLEAEWSAWNVDLASLEFLLHSADPKVLLRLIDCESRYLMLRSMMTKRSKMVEELVQPLVHRRSRPVAADAWHVDGQAIANEIGLDLAYKITQLADEIVATTASLLVMLIETQKRLHSTAKDFFPAREIIFFALIVDPADPGVGGPARVNAPAAQPR